MVRVLAVPEHQQLSVRETSREGSLPAAVSSSQGCGLREGLYCYSVARQTAEDRHEAHLCVSSMLLGPVRHRLAGASPPAPPILGRGASLQLSWIPSSFQDVDLNHYRIGKIEGFAVLKKVKVRPLSPGNTGTSLTEARFCRKCLPPSRAAISTGTPNVAGLTEASGLFPTPGGARDGRTPACVVSTHFR